MQNRLLLVFWILVSTLLVPVSSKAAEGNVNALIATPTASATSQPHTNIPKSPTIASPTLPALDKLLTHLVDGAIRPLYQEADEAAKQLVKQSDEFCQTPTEVSFKALREQWGRTMLAWQRTDALAFGPALEQQRDFHINFSPPKKLVINRLLADSNPLTLETLVKAGVGGQGLSTLEFLLFDREKADAGQLAAFQGETGKRRCAYVQTASQLLQQDIHTVASAWLSNAADSYASAFKQADQGNAHFASAQQAIDTIVAKLYQSAEKTAKTRIGKPLGKTLNVNTEHNQVMQIPANAYELEGWRSGYSLAMARANVEGIQRILRDGGLFTWLREQNPQQVGQFVAQAMQVQLENYLNLPVPTTDAFTLIEQGKSKELEGYYYLGNGIHMSIKRQLAKILKTPLGFSENDGD